MAITAGKEKCVEAKHVGCAIGRTSDESAPHRWRNPGVIIAGSTETTPQGRSATAARLPSVPASAPPMGTEKSSAEQRTVPSRFRHRRHY